MSESALFEREIRVLGMKRSGTHAIATWLFGHFRKKDCMVLNNSSLSLKKIYRNNKNKAAAAQFPLKLSKLRKMKPNGGLINIVESLSLDEAARKLNDDRSSYNVLKRYYVEQYGVDRFSHREYSILLYRSCFNHLSSILNHYGLWKHVAIDFIEMSTQYELEAMGVTNRIPNKVVVLYDRWFSDIEYRKSISAKLGLRHTDKLLNKIWRLGSTFAKSKDEFQWRAQEMDVLNRYKMLHGYCGGKKKPFIIDKLLLNKKARLQLGNGHKV